MTENQYELLRSMIRLHITNEQQTALMWQGFVIKPAGAITASLASSKRDETTANIKVMQEALRAFEIMTESHYGFNRDSSSLAIEMRGNLEHE